MKSFGNNQLQTQRPLMQWYTGVEQGPWQSLSEVQGHQTTCLASPPMIIIPVSLQMLVVADKYIKIKIHVYIILDIIIKDGLNYRMQK